LFACLLISSLSTTSSFVSHVRPFTRPSKGLFVKEVDFSTQAPTYNDNAGKADSAFAKRFGHLAGKPVKTVSESMKTFSNECGGPINALYRNYMTDLVATTHLSVVDARFIMDPIWALGFITVTDVLLKNYPEKAFAEKMCTSLAKAVDLDYDVLKKEASKVSEWAQGKGAEDVAAALRGEGGSEVASVANTAKGDEFWLYTRFFGIGLIKIMELTGTEATEEVMAKWVKDDLGKTSQKAVADLDQWNGLNSKLSMMETLMKEIEIREKKKMADRLEDKAKAAIAKAERQKEIDDAMKVEE